VGAAAIGVFFEWYAVLMARSGRVFIDRPIGQKIAGLALLAAIFVTGAGFTASKYSSAVAASWLDQVFGNFGAQSRSSYRARDVRRQGYTIGRIDPQLKSTRKKRRLYRIPNASTSIYAARSRSYRTMCVRTCDGFFFPVSFATTKNRLKKDETVCKSSCGAPAQLYYYPNPGGEIEDMISYRGNKKYKKLKYAFLYQTKFVASCRCQPEPWTQAAKQKHEKYASMEKAQSKRLAALKKASSKKRMSRKRLKKRRKARRYSRRSTRNRRRAVRRVGLRKTTHRKSTRRIYRQKRVR